MATTRKILRLAPSGPKVQNAEGGMAVPGPGFQLRMAELKATIGGTITTAEAELGSGSDLRVKLDDVSPNLEYKAELQISSFYTTSDGPARLRVAIQRSLDDGVTWQTVMSDFFDTRQSANARMAVANVPMQLGSSIFWDLPEEVPEAGLSMTVRAVVQTTEAGMVAVIPNQQGFISLSELL